MMIHVISELRWLWCSNSGSNADLHYMLFYDVHVHTLTLYMVCLHKVGCFQMCLQAKPNSLTCMIDHGKKRYLYQYDTVVALVGS